MSTRRNSLAPNPADLAGDLENKSMESTGVESKEDPAPAKGGAIVTVKMLHHTTHDGRDLIPGHQYEVPSPVARAMVAARRAVRV